MKVKGFFDERSIDWREEMGLRKKKMAVRVNVQGKGICPNGSSTATFSHSFSISFIAFSPFLGTNTRVCVFACVCVYVGVRIDVWQNDRDNKSCDIASKAI